MNHNDNIVIYTLKQILLFVYPIANLPFFLTNRTLILFEQQYAQLNNLFLGSLAGRNGHVTSLWPTDVHTNIQSRKKYCLRDKKEAIQQGSALCPPPSTFLECSCNAGAATAICEHNQERKILKMVEQKLEGARVLNGTVEPLCQPRKVFLYNSFYVRKNPYLFQPL